MGPQVTRAGKNRRKRPFSYNRCSKGDSPCGQMPAKTPKRAVWRPSAPAGKAFVQQKLK
ncbi:MAG: hypothetical protein AVDCRST_MAG56-1049 [uncultured Cytophagales bacterium]|uniref:Uncharacterized protein n=1 Tax=uncultured Cytophagales bacterium TaxID=158755 RepID=A0A6J4HW14_9SPHI|nr:MAG: hypothetical protein AVDCRST_MAG56-1049 [uncultured Cytophagales bacterium]